MVERPGETIYKGHRSYDLMLNLQLGVRHAVGTLASRPAQGGLQLLDFQEKVCLGFRVWDSGYEDQGPGW